MAELASPLPDVPVEAEGVTLAAAPPLARYSLRTRNPVGLPTRVLSSMACHGGHALCLGPDEWLLILPDGTPPPVLDDPHALIDIGHRNVGFVVEGPAAAALLQTGIALDLALAAFPPGKATRTVFEGVEIVLWRTADQRFHVETWRSFAPYLWTALTLAMRDLR